MRIGILTHPLGSNYGGLLQCYALYTYLYKMGHNPIVIRRERDKSFYIWELVRLVLKKLHFPRYYNPNTIDKTKKIRPFIVSHLICTLPVHSQAQMNEICCKYQLEAVIVGSDQVWRRDFALNFGYNYFLDFVPKTIKKFSYAASLGLSDWQYDKNQTSMLKLMLSEFAGVSLREFDAIELFKNNLGIEAIQHIDPTLLLDIDDYSKIASPRKLKENYIFVYWLGPKDFVQKKITQIEESGIKVVTLFLRDNIEQMSVEDWLSYIKYADKVITDSFHGCVFSIIFQKQFVVELNESGGVGRVKSLLRMLNIEEYVINQSCIDYSVVHKRIEGLRKESNEYFLKCLK